MTERLLRASDVARLLDVKISTVYSLCRRGDLPHVRLAEGRRRPLIRFRREDIERLIRTATVGVEPRG